MLKNEQARLERLETILEYCLPSLDSIDDRKVIMSKNCFDHAQLINCNIDWLILLGKGDLAKQYAEKGMRLIKESIERGEWPKGMSRSGYPPSLIRWRKYEYLHGLSWMVTDVECEDTLKTALEAAQEFMDQILEQNRPKYLCEYTMAFVSLLGKLGMFTVATDAIERLRERGAKRKKRVVSRTAGIARFCLEVRGTVLKTKQESVRMRELAALLDAMGIAENGEYEASEIGEIDEFWMCYIICKFVPDYVQAAFTRVNIQQPIRHLVPEMLGASEQ